MKDLRHPRIAYLTLSILFGITAMTGMVGSAIAGTNGCPAGGTSSGTKSDTCGYNDKATGTDSSAFGYSNRVYAAHGSAFGYKNTVYASAGGYSNALGGDNRVGSSVGAVGAYIRDNAVGSANIATKNGASAFGSINAAEGGAPARSVTIT